jgi:hypothetical protein
MPNIISDILDALIEIQLECRDCVEEYEHFPERAKYERWDRMLEKAIIIIKWVKKKFGWVDALKREAA